MAYHWHSNQWLTVAAPGTPSVAFADDGDGTGATATITGSDADAINTVWTQAFNGSLGTATWTSSGSRIGNGEVSLTLTTGHYLGYVTSASGEGTSASTVTYFVVTSSTEAILSQILDAVRSRIQSISLSGIVNASVVVKKLELRRIYRRPDGVALPCVLITPYRPTFSAADGVTSFDDVKYGVQVTMISADNQEPTIEADMDRQILWYEKIAKAFRNQLLSGVSEVFTATVEPSDVVIPPAWRANLLASAMTLRITARETRGL